MKLLLINTIPTGFNGITNAIFNLLSALQGKEIEIDFVTTKEPEKTFRDIIENNWGNIHIFPRDERPVLYFRSLYRLIKQNKYDIVHTHGNSHTMALEMLAAKMAGCRVRISHGQNSTCYHLNLHRILTPLFKATCNYGFACSRNAGEFLFRDMPFTVLKNGIDMKKFIFDERNREKIRKELNMEECIVIGNVAAMRREKNQLFLIDVFSELYKTDKRYRMILVGDGKDRKLIEEKIEGLGLSAAVHLTGFADDAIYLSAMDAIVMPSVFEGLPVSLIEEQTNGLRCFISENITKEIDTTGENIFISLEKTASEWADIISGTSIVRDQKFAEYCFKRTREAGFDINDEADWIMNFYQRCVNDIY